MDDVKRSPMPARVIPMPERHVAVVIQLRGERPPLAQVTRLRHRSAKTEAVYRTRRRPLVAELFAEPVVCEVPWCTTTATDPHEPRCRARGGDIADRANVRRICRTCHQKIHDTEPAWAYRYGFLIHSWDLDGGDAA